MKNLVKKTALSAVLVMVAFPSLAMTEANMSRLIAMGFDREAVESLDEKQLKKVEIALHNGSDSDARMVVNSILLNSIMMEMMKK